MPLKHGDDTKMDMEGIDTSSQEQIHALTSCLPEEDALVLKERKRKQQIPDTTGINWTNAYEIGDLMEV